MPRITKAHLKESIKIFAEEVVKLIKERLDIENEKENETIEFEYGGWYYYLHKNIFYESVKPEICVKRRNFKRGITKENKGNHITETAFVYKEGRNCEVYYDKKLDKKIYGKDTGYIYDGLSFYNYSKTAF